MLIHLILGFRRVVSDQGHNFLLNHLLGLWLSQCVCATNVHVLSLCQSVPYMCTLCLENRFSQLRLRVVHANVQDTVVHRGVDILYLYNTASIWHEMTGHFWAK